MRVPAPCHGGMSDAGFWIPAAAVNREPSGQLKASSAESDKWKRTNGAKGAIPVQRRVFISLCAFTSHNNTN